MTNHIGNFSDDTTPTPAPRPEVQEAIAEELEVFYLMRVERMLRTLKRELELTDDDLLFCVISTIDKVEPEAVEGERIACALLRMIETHEIVTADRLKKVAQKWGYKPPYGRSTPSIMLAEMAALHGIA